MSDAIETGAGTALARLRLRPFRPDDLEPVAAVATAANVEDGLPFTTPPEVFELEVLGFPGIEPARDIVVAELDGAIVGAAWLRSAVRDDEWRHDHDGAVVPAMRGRGIGRALVHAMIAAARERAALEAARTTPTPDESETVAAAGGPQRLTTTTTDSNEREVRLIASEGYHQARWFALMTRELALPVPAPVAVDGIELRSLAAGHHRAAFDTLEAAFRDHYGHREWTDDDFARFFDGRDTSLWRVAWAGDRVVGVSKNAFEADEAARLGIRQGWIEQIGVRREWRGRGVGRLLMAASLVAFADAGFERAILGVDLDNPTGALGLYESLGFVVAQRATEWMRDLESTETPA